MYLYTYMYMCEVGKGRMYIWYMYICIDFLVEYFFCVTRVVKLNVEAVCTYI